MFVFQQIEPIHSERHPGDFCLRAIVQNVEQRAAYVAITEEDFHVHVAGDKILDYVVVAVDHRVLPTEAGGFSFGDS